MDNIQIGLGVVAVILWIGFVMWYNPNLGVMGIVLPSFVTYLTFRYISVFDFLKSFSGQQLQLVLLLFLTFLAIAVKFYTIMIKSMTESVNDNQK